MESHVGLAAFKSMSDQGTPVQVIEGDGGNAEISRAKNQLGVTITKKLDKTHCIKTLPYHFVIWNQRSKLIIKSLHI